jgi:hypothetical protein
MAVAEAWDMPLITKNKYVFAAIFVFAGVGPIFLAMAVAQRGDSVAGQAPTSAETVTLANR